MAGEDVLLFANIQKYQRLLKPALLQTLFCAELGDKEADPTVL